MDTRVNPQECSIPNANLFFFIVLSDEKLVSGRPPLRSNLVRSDQRQCSVDSRHSNRSDHRPHGQFDVRLSTINQEYRSRSNVSSLDRFFMPHGLSSDRDGNLWLTDVALHQVRRIVSLSPLTECSFSGLQIFKWSNGNDARRTLCSWKRRETFL